MEYFSSLKMNVEKCEACWIGRSKGDTDKPVKCKWISLTNNTIKILGTHFSYNKLLEKKMNFYYLVTDCRILLNIWKQRWLSLAGKIQVFKSLIASKPVYIATMKSLPQDVQDELHRMQKEFPWQGKRAKIKHSMMIGSYEKGGLKDVDLESKFQSLRIIWVRKILDKTNFHPWMAIANTVLQDLGGVNIFHTNLLIIDHESVMLFLKKILSSSMLKS